MKTNLIRQPLATSARIDSNSMCLQHRFVQVFALTTILWASCFIWTAAGQSTDAYFARIRPTGGVDTVIENGVLVVRDGKIIAVGEVDQIQVPSDAIQHRLSGVTLVPGMVIAQTGLIDQRDINYTLTPDVQALDGFDFTAERVSLLAAGITTVQITPSGNRLLPGVTAVVKLTGTKEDLSDDSRVLQREESLRIALDSSSRNAPSIFEPPVGPVSIERPLEPTRPQVSLTLSSSLAALRSIFKQATADETFASFEEDQVVPSVAQFLRRTRRVRVSAENEAEIRAALDLAHQFDLELILVNANSPRLIDLLDQYQKTGKLPEIKGFVFSVPRPGGIGSVSQESLDRSEQQKKTIQRLVNDGWQVTFTTTSDNDLRDVLYAMADFSGLSDLGLLTQTAAQILGVSDRVGSLEPGKDADFVALPTTPQLSHALPLMTFINGKKVFDRTPQPTATVISAKEIYVGDGHVIQDASLVVKGQTLRSLSNEYSAPLDAVRFEFPDGVIVPGFVDLGATLGTGAAITGNIPLNSTLYQQLYADDPAIKLARQQGVTAALIGSMNSNQPTPLFAIKLGDEPRVIKEAPAAIRFSIGANAAASATSLKGVLNRAKQYVDSWAKYERDLAEYEVKKAQIEKQQAEEKKEADKSEENKTEEEKKTDSTESSNPPAGRPAARNRAPGGRPGADRTSQPAADAQPKTDEEAKEDGKPEDKPAESKSEEGKPEPKKLEPPKPPTKRPELEPYKDLFGGKIPAFVEARTPEAIEEAIKLFRDEFDLKTVLCGADGLARFPELAKDKQLMVVAGPDLVLDIATPQQPTRRANLAEILINEGFVTAFQSKSAAGVGRLPAVVQFAINQGLGVHDGLRGLTQNSTKIIGTGFSSGCIQVGCDADFVVLSGPPFEASTQVLAVMIDGNWVYFREDQKK